VVEPVRAKDACVTHLYQAMCRRPGCGWVGELRGAWREASDDRQAHLDSHKTLMAAFGEEASGA